MDRHCPLQPFPRGWFCVAYAHEVQRGQVVSRRLAGNDLVVYRTESGRAVAMVIMVTGKALTTQSEVVNQAGMHSGQGNVVARAIRVRDGRVLASSTQHSAQLHIDLPTARLLALNDAAKLASTELVRKMTKS